MRTLLSRLLSFVRGRRLDGELREEIDAHVALLTDTYVRRGLSHEAASAAARREFGGIDQVKESYRDRRGLPLIESLVQDIRYAARSLRRSPGFTLTAVTILAVGIGVNTAVFTVTNAVLFRGYRTIDQNDRLVYIGTREGCCVSYPDFEDWATQTRTFQGLGAVADRRVGLSDEAGAADSHTATLISANGFRILDQRPLIGRDFTPSDATAGASPVAILSYRLWEQRFNRDTGAVGRTVRIDNVPTTVIGVMPEGFSFPQNQALWLPLLSTPEWQARDARNLWFAFGRLAEGATLNSARAELATIGQRLAQVYPSTNRGVAPLPQTFSQFFLGQNAAAIYTTLWGAVGLVLLIACANLASLLLGRSMRRSREMSVRVALGAGRWRLVRMLLVESVMLSSLGGATGWWLARGCLRAYKTFAHPSAQSWSAGLMNLDMDGQVLTYLSLTSIGVGLLFGSVPALRMSTVAGLRRGSRSVASSRRPGLAALMTTGEVALAFVLLAGAGVVTKSFLNIHAADLGFDASRILTGLIRLPLSRYDSPSVQLAFFEQLTTRLETSPGVTAAALASAPPGQGRPVSLETRLDQPLVGRRRPTASTLAVSHGYFQTLGVALTAGRAFTNSDNEAAPRVAIVNHRLASQHWPAGDAIGQQLRLVTGTGPGPWLTIVGIAPDVGNNGPLRLAFGVGAAPDPMAYVPIRQAPGTAMWFFTRTDAEPASLTSAVRNHVQALDRELPIWIGPVTLSERLAVPYWDRGVQSVVFAALAVIALVVAVFGLYTVVAQSVSGRTQEFGVRIAIGATARSILTLVLRQGLVPVGLGLLLGFMASIGTNRILTSQLVQVSPFDPVTLLVAAVALGLAAALGCLIPARRATLVDPAVALRHD